MSDALSFLPNALALVSSKNFKNAIAVTLHLIQHFNQFGAIQFTSSLETESFSQRVEVLAG